MALETSDASERVLTLERKILRLRAILDEMVIYRMPRAEQQLAMLWATGPRRQAQVVGDVEGCADLGFPGATVEVKDATSGARLGSGTANSSGRYQVWVNLASDPQSVDVVASPAGPYAARFAGPVTESGVSLHMGGNSGPTITLLPATGYCCGETDYFPATCDCAVVVITNGCSGKAIAGTLIELYRPDDHGTVVASGTSAAGTVDGVDTAYYRFEGLSGEYDVKLTPPAGYDFASDFTASGLLAECAEGETEVVYTKTLTPSPGHSCICSCAAAWPTTLYIEDSNGLHALTPLGVTGRAWRATYVAPGTVVNDSTPCTEAGTGVNVRYDLELTCDGPGAGWRLTISFGTKCCGAIGPTPAAFRYCNTTGNQTHSGTAPYSSSDCNQETLEFTLPATVSGTPGGECAAMSLPVPGGGGALVVSR